MYKVHSNDRNEHKEEPHDAKAPRGLHNMSNEQLNVMHLYFLCLIGHVSSMAEISNKIKANTNNMLMLDNPNLLFVLFCIVDPTRQYRCKEQYERDTCHQYREDHQRFSRIP